MHLIDTHSPVSEKMALSQLSHAVKAGDAEGIDQILVRLQGDYYIVRDGIFQGWTPVHCAAYLGCLSALTTILQEKQAYVHLQTVKNRETPLHLAALLGNVDCLNLLLHAGSDIKAKDVMGETALHKAARCGNVECLRMLIGCGSDLSVANERGQTPADVAESCGHVECGTYLRQALTLQRKGLYPPFDPRENHQNNAFSESYTRDNDVDMDVIHEEDMRPFCSRIS
ncbi:unnamed protein product [Soboliphyme baturini]|uniref:ANK_REP_REGION domain-containing protein n=1 Tax=Soboliphyme baturini TaxID=241478 RepID=A0A183J796_9BILA|nr:unnamed protein product [Soboliphyme baturini]